MDTQKLSWTFWNYQISWILKKGETNKNNKKKRNLIFVIIYGINGFCMWVFFFFFSLCVRVFYFLFYFFLCLRFGCVTFFFYFRPHMYFGVLVNCMSEDLAVFVLFWFFDFFDLKIIFLSLFSL